MEYKALGEIATITSSKRIFAEQYVSDGIPFYRQKEIIEKHDKKQISDPLFISEEVYEAIKAKYGIPKQGDLLLSAVGVTLGIPYVVQNECFYFKDGNLIWLKDFNSEVNSKYIYYWLDSKFGLESIFIRAIGSAQPALTIDLVKKYKMFFPKRKTQDKIANILSRYDEAIENNNKRIKLLEQMAQNLYKEWLVRFRFPGWQNAEFENGIPKEWKVEKLFDVVNVTYGYAFASELFCDDESLNSVVRIRDILDNHTNTFTSETCSDKYIIKENEILVGMDGIFHMCMWNGEKAYQNQRVVKLTSKTDEISNYFLFLSVQPQVKFWEQTIAGTTVAHLGDKHLKRMTVLLPSENILKEATKIFDSLMKQKNQLFKANINLAKQRDLLLPRLMSGKLEVK